jgi:hypothetical protein
MYIKNIHTIYYFISTVYKILLSIPLTMCTRVHQSHDWQLPEQLLMDTCTVAHSQQPRPIQRKRGIRRERVPNDDRCRLEPRYVLFSVFLYLTNSFFIRFFIGIKYCGTSHTTRQHCHVPPPPSTSRRHQRSQLCHDGTQQPPPAVS